MARRRLYAAAAILFLQKGERAWIFSFSITCRGDHDAISYKHDDQPTIRDGPTVERKAAANPALPCFRLSAAVF